MMVSFNVVRKKKNVFDRKKKLIEKFVVDLYSLGPDLITQLWDITEKKSKSSAALSPFSLVQANTVFLDD